jgi:hypothetical protein
LLFRSRDNSKKNRRNKAAKDDDDNAGVNDVVDAKGPATDDGAAVVPASTAFEREQLVKIKKAMDLLQLQVCENYTLEICV